MEYQIERIPAINHEVEGEKQRQQYLQAVTQQVHITILNIEADDRVKHRPLPLRQRQNQKATYLIRSETPASPRQSRQTRPNNRQHLGIVH